MNIMYRILILFSCLICFSCNFNNKKNNKIDTNIQNKTKKVFVDNNNIKKINPPGLVIIDTYILETKYQTNYLLTRLYPLIKFK